MHDLKKPAIAKLATASDWPHDTSNNVLSIRATYCLLRDSWLQQRQSWDWHTKSACLLHGIPLKTCYYTITTVVCIWLGDSELPTTSCKLYLKPFSSHLMALVGRMCIDVSFLMSSFHLQWVSSLELLLEYWAWWLFFGVLHSAYAWKFPHVPCIRYTTRGLSKTWRRLPLCSPTLEQGTKAWPLYTLHPPRLLLFDKYFIISPVEHTSSYL